MTVQNKKDFLVKTAYAAVVTALIFIVCRFLVIYFFPFLIGLTLAYFLQKPSRAAAKKLHIKTGYVACVSVAVSYAAVIAVIGLLCFALIINFPRISADVQNLLSEVSEYLHNFSVKMPDSIKSIFIRDGKSVTQTVSGYVSSYMAAILQRVVKNAPSFLFCTVITVVASCYIAKDYEAVRQYALSLMPPRTVQITAAVIRIVKTNVFRIIKGYIILMVITFALLTVGFFIAGIKNAVVLAALIAFIDLLPVLGTGTVLIPWSIVCFVRSDFKTGIALVLIYAAALCAHNALEPKVVGRQIGIPPLVMLICIFIGLRLFGFLGMILSVISLTVIINLYKENIL